MEGGVGGRFWRAAVAVPVLIGVLAFGLRVAQSSSTFTVTTDEPNWLIRADGFRSALRHGDLSRATAAHQIPDQEVSTMPGVTTLWAANVGRGLAHLGAALGVNEPVTGPSVNSPTVLRAARGVVAATSGALIGIIVALAWRVFGRAVATVAGLLLATEPWFVGHGNVLHTDQLLTLFGAIAMLGLAWGFARHGSASGLTDPARPLRPAGWIAFGSGAFAGLAVLTKLSALALVVPGAVIVVLAHTLPGARALPGPWRRRALELLRAWGRLGLWWSAGAVGVFIALWPALWVAPLDQWRDLTASAGLAGEGHVQFFLGSRTSAPGVIYYPVAWAFRMSPWMLIGAVAVAVTVLVQLVRWVLDRLPGRTATDRRPGGPVPLWLLLVGMPYAVAITVSTKTFDRYVTPLYPYLALAIGTVVAAVVAWVRRSGRAPAWSRPVAVVGGLVTIALVSMVSAARSPYAISYVNPMLGGQHKAREVLLLGWGEARAPMASAVADHEDDCDGVVVAVPGRGPELMVTCGTAVRLKNWVEDPRSGDYVVTIRNMKQRLGGHPELLMSDLDWIEVDRVEIDGLAYAWLWQVDRP